MGYRKFKADKIFTGREMIENAVLVTDQNGTVESIVAMADAGADIEIFSGMVCPGFINCHCHLELSHMKGLIPEKTGMTDFVLAVVQQRHFPEEEILKAIAAAEEEMLQNGIVAVGDICNNSITLEQKKKQRLYYHNFIEVSGFVPAIAEQRFSRAIDLYNVFAQTSSLPAYSNSLVPHAPYSVSKALFQKIVHFPASPLISMHNQESPAEEELFLDKKGDFLRMYSGMNIDASFFEPTGLNSLQSVFPFFLRHQRILLVHNVTTTAADVEYLKKRDAAICFCVCLNANEYIGNGIPSVPLLQQSGFPIVLGTDSLASNRQLSMVEEIKSIQKNFPGIPLAQILTWATINGAEALQCQEWAGSFEKGKKPGILLLEEATGSAIGNRVQRLL